jgi:hypothetical protein
MIEIKVEPKSNQKHSQPHAFTLTGYFSGEKVEATYEGTIEELIAEIKKPAAKAGLIKSDPFTAVSLGETLNEFEVYTS